MKKCLCLVLSALIFTASFCFDVSAFAAQSSIERTQLGTTDTYYEYDAPSKTLTISGTGAMPDMKNNASSQPWYDWRSDGSIENVIIEEGITYVGNYCFFSVKANNFIIPDTLSSTGRYAFSSSSIKNVELPFGFTTINSYAFYSCSELESIIIPDTVTTVSSYAFSLCTALESITIPYSVKSIAMYAFDRCTALNTVIFEDMTSSVSIGSNAFYDCTSIGAVSFPENASIASKAFGYGQYGAPENAKMMVYNSSKAHIYAVSNSIPFEILDDSAPLTLGVKNTLSFDENSLDKVYTFTFTPEFSGVYNFYSLGDCDVKATLYSGNELICESDDISDSDRNFCLTAQLEQDVPYTFKVASMMSAGTAKAVLYPDEILSFDIDGSLTFNAADGFRSSDTAYFPIVNSLLSDFVLDVHFAGGYSDKIYCSAGSFNNKQIALYDTQNTNRFTCGENRETVKIGDVSSDFPVYVNHSYNSTVVPYTAYDDGYTIYTCMLCGDEYTGDYIESPAITVSGRVLLATGNDDMYDASYPLTESVIEFGSNQYTPDEAGRFSFRTLESGELVIKNPYCADTVLTVVNDYHDINYGAIPLPAYDFNGDGIINGRDLAVFKTQHRQRLGKQYFKYAVNFM